MHVVSGNGINQIEFTICYRTRRYGKLICLNHVFIPYNIKLYDYIISFPFRQSLLLFNQVNINQVKHIIIYSMYHQLTIRPFSFILFLLHL